MKRNFKEFRAEHKTATDLFKDFMRKGIDTKEQLKNLGYEITNNMDPVYSISVLSKGNTPIKAMRNHG